MTAAAVRHLANRCLHPLGLHIARRGRAFEMADLLAGAAARGHEVRTWIDVGASDGKWSVQAKRYFPDARFLLMEPLEERRAALEQLQVRHQFRPVIAAAGAAPGRARLHVDRGLDGSAIAAGADEPGRDVAVETVDGAVARSEWPGPYGLKLDTHGYELPVLAGARHVLAHASLVIIEAYNFRLTGASLRFPELCLELEKLGLRVCDLADPMRRPGDRALWQMDLAFAPATHAVFHSNSYLPAAPKGGTGAGPAA